MAGATGCTKRKPYSKAAIRGQSCILNDKERMC